MKYFKSLFICSFFLTINAVWATNHYCKPTLINNTGVELDEIYVHTWANSTGNNINLLALGTDSSNNTKVADGVIGGYYEVDNNHLPSGYTSWTLSLYANGDFYYFKVDVANDGDSDDYKIYKSGEASTIGLWGKDTESIETSNDPSSAFDGKIVFTAITDPSISTTSGENNISSIIATFTTDCYGKSSSCAFKLDKKTPTETYPLQTTMSIVNSSSYYLQVTKATNNNQNVALNTDINGTFFSLEVTAPMGSEEYGKYPYLIKPKYTADIRGFILMTPKYDFQLKADYLISDEQTPNCLIDVYEDAALTNKLGTIALNAKPILLSSSGMEQNNYTDYTTDFLKSDNDYWSIIMYYIKGYEGTHPIKLSSKYANNEIQLYDANIHTILQGVTSTNNSEVSLSESKIVFIDSTTEESL